MRRSLVRLALLGAALSGLLATCRYDSAGPRHGGPAYLAVQPIVGLGVDLAAFGLTADTIRLVVTRSSADTLRALTFFFDPDSSQIRLAADVTLRALVETVTVLPAPTLLSVVSGAGQRGIVGLALALPFRVRVTAADALGVKGIPVLFRALGGLPGVGGVTDSVVVSDTGGYAETVATLGTVAGVQGFDARVLALPATSFTATALAGAVSSATSVVTATATSVLSGAIATLTLHAKDAFGNALTTGGSTVAFNVTGGTSTGTIGPAVDHGDGT